MGMISINGFFCERCSHKWISRENSEHIPIVCPKCLPPDAFLDGEFKKIKDFRAGDIAIGSSGKETNVEQIFSHDFEGELIEVFAQGCLPVKFTPDHKVLVIHVVQKSRSSVRKFSRNFLKPQWVEAKDLIKRPLSENINSCGDYLVIPKIKTNFSSKKISLSGFTTPHGLKVMAGKNASLTFPINKDSAWLLGLYVAEGVSSQNGEITLCLGKHETELIKEALIKINNIGLSFNVKDGPTTRNVTFYSRPISKAIKEWCGKDCYNKKIPYFIFNNKNLNILENFIIGYLRGDGFIRKYAGRTQIIANTVSKTLALQLQLLSVRLNSFFNITQTDFSKYKSVLPDGRIIRGGKGFKLVSNAGPITLLMGERAKSRHNKSYVLFKDYVAVPINKLQRINYSGKVMNIQTKEGNYLYNNITVKNCKSPYWNIKRKIKNGRGVKK